MRKSKLLLRTAAGIAALVLAAGTLTACGQKNTGEKESDKETVQEGEGAGLTVAASPTPHAEILEHAKSLLKEKGIEFKVVEFTDYVQPNMVLDAGEVDANFFQHFPYLDDFNAEKGTKLVSAGAIHYEPLGIYPGKSDDLKNVLEGAKIAVPNDTTNEARALLLLETNGIIKLKEDAGFKATVQDIVDNPYNVEIVELEAAQVARVKDEVDFVVVNGNYALLAGLNVQTDAIAKEEQDSDAAKTYANVIAVKEGDEQREDILALIEVLKSEDMKSFIEEKYQGSVVIAE